MLYTEKINKVGTDTLILALPDWKTFDPQEALIQLEALIAKGTALADKQAGEKEHTFLSLILPWEELSAEFTRVWGPVGHMNNVDKDTYPDLTHIHDKGAMLLSRYGSAIGMHEGLARAYRTYLESKEFMTLSAGYQKIVTDALRDFRLAGVDLPKEKKERLVEINERLTELGNKFGDNVTDAQSLWKKHITDETALTGIPDATRAAMRAAAESEGKEGYLLTVHQPIYMSVIQYADDRELRRLSYEAYMTRASDQGPSAGTAKDNAPLMNEIVSLRNEKAILLGFTTYNEYSLARKMAPSVARVDEFLRDMNARVHERAVTEINTLKDFAKVDLGLTELFPWDVSYVAEKKRKKDFDIDHEEIRAYFPVTQVFTGLFALLEKIYGVTFHEEKDVSVWRAEVTFFSMRDSHGALRGGVYADLFARNGKRPGAWMDTCVERITIDHSTTLPVAYFNCNFTQPEEGEVATLRHDEVETLFHEFGHVLHHILGKADLPSIGMGVVEWDAIEYPSQIMEYWCWEKDMLPLLSSHVATKEKLPARMIDRLLASQRYNAGMFLARQLTFATFDWELHRRAAGGVFDLQAAWTETRDRIGVVPTPQWERFINAFNHIFDGSYAAGYYSYLWAETLAADVFEEFVLKGIFDRATGEKYLREILEVGGTRPMMESFRAFRGRDPKPDALLRRYGLLKE